MNDYLQGLLCFLAFGTCLFFLLNILVVFKRTSQSCPNGGSHDWEEFSYQDGIEHPTTYCQCTKCHEKRWQ